MFVLVRLSHRRWSILDLASPCTIRQGPHFERECSTFSDISMCKPWPLERLTVEFRRLNVFVLRRNVVSNNGKGLSVSHADLGLLEEWTAYLVHRGSWTDWI